LALIQAHKQCADSSNLQALTEKISERSNWLRVPLLEAMQQDAKRNNDTRAWVELQVKMAALSAKVREKIDLLESAMETVELWPRPLNERDQNIVNDVETRLFAMAPRRIPEPSPEDYFKVGSDWIFQREFKKGRSYLKKVSLSAEASADEKYLALRAIRNSYKTEMDKKSHLQQCRLLTRWLQNQVKSGNSSFVGKTHEAFLTWARAEWTEGHTKLAKNILQQAEKFLSGRMSLAEIYYIRAKIYEEAKDYPRTLKTLEQASQDRPRSSLKEKILFSRAWLEKKLGHHDQAVQLFRELKSDTEDPFDHARYSFWLAKSLRQSKIDNKDSLADQEFKDLTEQDPLGYYGLLSYRELRQSFPALPNSRSNFGKRPDSLSGDEHQLILSLIFVRENELLEKVLNEKTNLLERSPAGTDESANAQWLYYLKAYAQAGLFQQLFQQLGTLPAETRMALLTSNSDLLFPQRYMDLIEPAAKKYGVEPEFVLSVIRQESAFNPQARSPADALGLMQVIPAVAKIQEKITGIKIKQFEDLYDPSTNVEIGTSLVSHLQAKYRGQMVLMAASYNASERAIENWINTRLEDDPLQFIEDIPYEETRGYVKLVLRNYIFYQRLSHPGESLPFPQHCLDNLQSFKVSTSERQ